LTIRRLRPRGPAFPAKAGDWAVNGGFLVGFSLAMRMQHLTFALALTLSMPLTSAAGPLQDDLVARRGKLMERLGPDTLAIFWSAPTRVYSGDVDYEYPPGEQPPV
jgi:hypothetical protein